MNVTNGWRFLQGFFIKKTLTWMIFGILGTIIFGWLTGTPVIWLGPVGIISCFVLVIVVLDQLSKSAARTLRNDVTKYAPTGKFRIIVRLSNSELHQLGKDQDTLEEARQVRRRFTGKHLIQIYDEANPIE